MGHATTPAQTVHACAIVGIWVAAIVAGYATVSLPYSYLALFVAPVTQRHVRILETQLT